MTHGPTTTRRLLALATLLFAAFTLAACSGGKSAGSAAPANNEKACASVRSLRTDVVSLNDQQAKGMSLADTMKANMTMGTRFHATAGQAATPDLAGALNFLGDYVMMSVNDQKAHATELDQNKAVTRTLCP